MKHKVYNLDKKHYISRELLLHCGHMGENKTHTQRVALMPSRKTRKTPIRWEAQGDRIIETSAKSKKENIAMNIAHWYTPINDVSEDDEDLFYQRIQSIPKKCPGKSLTIFSKDLKPQSQNRLYRVRTHHKAKRTGRKEWELWETDICIYYEEHGYRLHHFPSQIHGIHRITPTDRPHLDQQKN